uniref:PiggyBac transposable element-derived protein domain-containing protein n=1 Tax=Timema poppense TaxID=170557 RepID=A0A7R9CSF6_TIMPO|nr:unnamed protein product [Timema poppensis]
MKIGTPSRKWQSLNLPFAPELNWEHPEWVQNRYSPIELFEMFFDDEFLELLTNCSNNFAFQKGNIKFKVTANDIKVPRYRIYWETSSDTHNEEKPMSRNIFEDILKYLRGWLRNFPKDSNLSIDKAMITYYGRHGATQHNIHVKQIRFGYKVLCLCNRLGYLVQGERYQGASTGNTHHELCV